MELKEIIVITDGKSNVGGDPAGAALLAHKKGIIVNAIGIMDRGETEEPYIELENIAKAGAAYAIIPASMLGYSVQMVTMQSVQMTIERAVSRQLLADNGLLPGGYGAGFQVKDTGIHTESGKRGKP